MTTDQDRVVARAKADPAYRQMLMEDADLAARQEAEGHPPPALRLPPGMVLRAHDVLGVAHLLPRGALRYLCGRMPVAERFAWPVKSRCLWCVAALEEGRV